MVKDSLGLLEDFLWGSEVYLSWQIRLKRSAWKYVWTDEMKAILWESFKILAGVLLSVMTE